MYRSRHNVSSYCTVRSRHDVSSYYVRRYIDVVHCALKARCIVLLHCALHCALKARYIVLLCKTIHRCSALCAQGMTCRLTINALCSITLLVRCASCTDILHSAFTVRRYIVPWAHSAAHSAVRRRWHRAFSDTSCTVRCTTSTFL